MTANRPTVFNARWHRVALSVFIACWIAMLPPLIFFPEMPMARVVTLLLIAIGAVSVLTLLVAAIAFVR